MATTNVSTPQVGRKFQKYLETHPSVKAEFERKGSRLRTIVEEENRKHIRATRRFARFLENDLGPAHRPSDAQIGMIMGYVHKHYQPR